jgi:threonine synthase
MPAGAWTIGSAPDRRIDASVLQRIGGTPLVALRRIVPERCARLLIKLESANPTGSMKDRMALAMIEAAEQSGRLKPGGRVRRIHRRQHRRFARFHLRGARLFAQPRDIRRLQHR